jgi:Xaa-Pro aminopeptidase
MREAGVQAYIIYSSDPHGSEYVSEHWRCRSWLSGFTGSAGTVVVTSDRAGLWTDFRYFIQAAAELEGSGIELFRMGEVGVPSYQDWLKSELLERGAQGDGGSVIGVDGRTFTLKEWESLVSVVGGMGIGINGDLDLVGQIWTDRPAEPSGKVWALEDDEAGLSRKDKIAALLKELTSLGMKETMISSLDDIAWILNLRGSDVPCNPVIQSYLFLSEERKIWFVDASKISGELKSLLEGEGLALRPYDEVSGHMAGLEGPLYISADRISQALLSVLPEDCSVMKGTDISTRMKARKNDAEQKNIRKTMEKDGAAMTRFIIWFRKTLKERPVTELEAAGVLRSFREAQEGFLDESFSPIPGYAAHGAICHYEADPEGQYTLERKSLFLIDSGGQYRGGTTDITRTLAAGNPSEQERGDYTRVLKGHIALSRAVFPAGTRGYQLDILARQPLWNCGLNYGHGTGHGVGYILNVHEGPQRISPHPVDEALQEGMIVSNEPGIYREGEYGIRIENLIMVSPWRESPGTEEFFSFETLTLCPYERQLIDSSLLDKDEIDWINDYHQSVYKRLSPLLNEEEREWLREETLEIS